MGGCLVGLGGWVAEDVELDWDDVGLDWDDVGLDEEHVRLDGEDNLLVEVDVGVGLEGWVDSWVGC